MSDRLERFKLGDVLVEEILSRARVLFLEAYRTPGIYDKVLAAHAVSEMRASGAKHPLLQGVDSETLEEMLDAFTSGLEQEEAGAKLYGADATSSVARPGFSGDSAS